MHAPDSCAEPALPIRFGVRLEGLPVLLPAGLLLEFVPQARIWQLPLAPVGVAGLTHLRGHPIPVFDPGRWGAGVARREAAVLVVGEPTQAAALLVDEAPLRVELAAVGDACTDPGAALGAMVHDFPCPAALGEPCVDLAGMPWWPLDPDLLFAGLVGSIDEAAGAGVAMRSP